MRYSNKTLYSEQRNNEIKFATLGALQDANRALTIDEIKSCDLTLANVPNQKIARVLSELGEFNFITKSKNSNGRMIYRAVNG